MCVRVCVLIRLLLLRFFFFIFNKYRFFRIYGAFVLTHSRLCTTQTHTCTRSTVSTRITYYTQCMSSPKINCILMVRGLEVDDDIERHLKSKFFELRRANVCVCVWLAAINYLFLANCCRRRSSMMMTMMIFIRKKLVMRIVQFRSPLCIVNIRSICSPHNKKLNNIFNQK